jgi:hypothetical protein
MKREIERGRRARERCVGRGVIMGERESRMGFSVTEIFIAIGVANQFLHPI